MIYQNGPHSHISIQNSEAIQIGHGNTIVGLAAPAESGESPGRRRGRTWGSCSVWVGQGTGSSQPSEEKGRPSDHHALLHGLLSVRASFSCLDRTFLIPFLSNTVRPISQGTNLFP